MTEIEFDQFIKLVELDKEISQLYSDKDLVKNLIDQAEKDLRSKFLELEEAKKQLINVKKQADSLDLEIKAFDNQESEKKERIGQASNTKEYYSLENEIEEIKRQRAKIEEVLFKIWPELEELESQYNRINKETLDKEQQVSKEIVQFKERAAYLEKQINELTAIRPTYLGKVPQDLLDQYNSMKESVTYPVVPISNMNCSACFFMITQQDYNSLREHQLVRCKDCYRLLYLPHKIES